MSTGITRDGFVQELVSGSSHGLFVLDDTGTVVFGNGVLADCLGLDREDVVGDRLRDHAASGGVLERVREASTPPASELAIGLRTADGDREELVVSPESVEVDEEVYYTLWCDQRVLDTRDVSEQTHARTARTAPVALDDLTALWRRLLATDDPTAAADVALDALERLLGVDLACVRLLDEGSNALERITATEQAAELLASRPTFDMNRSLAGRAFRRDEPICETPAGSGGVFGRANLHAPVGDHGTLSVFGRGEGFTPRDEDLIEHVAAILGDAITAAAGPAATSTEESGAYALPMRELVTATIDGERRETITQGVCDRLIRTDGFDGAWFVETDIDGAWRSVEASAGDTDSPPEGVRRAATGVDDHDDPVNRAVETGEVCLVCRQRTVSETDGDDTETVETTAVVPVAHDDRTYGVLVVRSASGAVDGPVRTELDLLGDVVGLAVYAVQSKQLLLSETVQQLEFEVTDPDCLAVTVSEAAEAFCEIEHRTLTNDGDHLCYLKIDGCGADTARDATASIDSVHDCRVVDTDEKGCLIEVVKPDSGAEALMDVGATVRRATAEDGVGTLIVETPLSIDVREVVDAYTALNPESHLVAKREIDRSVSTADALDQRVEDRLTEKQLSVLTSAYYAGYFEWPRANTAEEIADSLDISPATLHQHLRTAERKVLELVCEDRSHSADAR